MSSITGHNNNFTCYQDRFNLMEQSEQVPPRDVITDTGTLLSFSQTQTIIKLRSIFY